MNDYTAKMYLGSDDLHPRVPWHPQILADQLTLSQQGGVDYAHLITTGPHGFLHPATALLYKVMYKTQMKSLKNLGCM